jgi:hypothetical protein
MVIQVAEFQRTLMPLFFKLCSDHISIEAIPRRPVAINFSEMKGRPFSGLELMMWTPHFVILKNTGGLEITLRKDGRMIVRNAPTEELARDAATEVMKLVLKDFSR